MLENFTPWTDHDGRDPVLRPAAWVELRFRAAPNSGQINPFDAGAYAADVAWFHDGKNDDVVQYRVRIEK